MMVFVVLNTGYCFMLLCPIELPIWIGLTSHDKFTSRFADFILKQNWNFFVKKSWSRTLTKLPWPSEDFDLQRSSSSSSSSLIFPTTLQLITTVSSNDLIIPLYRKPHSTVPPNSIVMSAPCENPLLKK